MKISCLVTAMLVAMTPKAAIAAEQTETTVTAQMAKGCATANEIAAKNDIRTFPTEMLVKGYCVFWSASQSTQAPASPGRLECLKASQGAGAELLRRGLPIVGLCN
jgi:hypothetical protein